MNIKIVMIIVFLVFGAAVVLANEFLFDFGTSFVLSNEFLFGSMTDDKPNIIVIMTDDLDVITLDTMLSKNWMPNLQKFIIENGTEFTNSFVTVSNCCPSRSTFLTGQYAHNHGVLTNIDGPKLDDSHTLATWLHKAGYRTGHVGKYLNLYGQVINSTYVPPGWDSWKALIEPYTYRVYDYKLSDNGKVVNYGNKTTDYQTDVLASISSDFITESKVIDEKVPFFLAINPSAPHAEQHVTKQCSIHGVPLGIIRGPPRYEETANQVSIIPNPSFNETDVSDKPAWVQALPSIDEGGFDCINMIYQNRIESMRAVDDLIGSIVETLKENQEFDKTVLIFTSDNGFLFGEHREWSKLNVYEESIRVPLFINAPGYSHGESSNLVINNDLAPTILEFAKTEPDIALDGRSLLPLLLNFNEEDWRSNFLIAYWPIKHWELMAYLPQIKGIRTTTHVYIDYENSTGEFYDLRNDPYQLNNLYSCTSKICQNQISELQNLLYDLQDCGNGSCKFFEDKKE